MLSVTDLFCGAGGSSSGAEAVPGVTVRMAANHWDLAIETHNHNMPHVDHDVAEIDETDPRRYPTTDLLWASPACTFWSQAAGRKVDFDDAATAPALFDLSALTDVEDEPAATEAKDRSRALMQDIPRFAEYHRYKAVIVENTIPLLKWAYFPRWIARMRALGYRHQVLTLNSAFAHQLGPPAPQLRDRVYVAFWREHYPTPDFEAWTRPQAWCPRCEQVVTALRASTSSHRAHGVYGQQYRYRCPLRSCRGTTVQPYTLPAAHIIDHSDSGVRIGDRERLGLPALKPRTMNRIEAGLARVFPQPPLGYPERSQLPVTVGADSGTTPPTLPRHGSCASDGAVLVPLRNHNRAKQSHEPLDTVAAHGNHHGLLTRHNSSRGSGAEMSTSLAEPARTFTAAGHHSVLIPYRRGSSPHSLGHPMSTIATREAHGLAQPATHLEDCFFRMLGPEEIKAGMAIDRQYVLLGNKRNRIKMCGNAVTPPVTRDLIACLVSALTGSNPAEQ